MVPEAPIAKAIQQAALEIAAGEHLEQFPIEPSGRVIGLLANNFECGDEERILDAIVFPDNPDLLHWQLIDVIKVLERNPEAVSSKLAVIAYASTPCQNCRFHAAQLLHKQGAAPTWMIDECHFDAEERCRTLFGENGGSVT